MLYRVFGDRVLDLLAIAVFRQIAERCLPSGLFGQDLLGDFRTVGQQADGDTYRSYPVLIIIILPDFGDGKVQCFRLVYIGDHITCLRVSASL